MIHREAFNEQAHAGLRVVALLATAAVAGIAVVALTAPWVLGGDSLRRLHLDHATMAPTTAVSFLALALVMLSRRPQRRSANLAGKVVALAVAVIAIGELAAAVVGLASPVDVLALLPGGQQSMAPATAICFVLGSTSVLAADNASRRIKALSVWSATAGLLLALTAMAGYAFDAKALYQMSIFTAMAFVTAFAFSLLFAGLLFMRPDLGWIHVIIGRDAGSVGARRLLPAVILVPLAFSYLALVLTDAGVLNANFRLSLIAVAMMALLTATVVHNAALQNAGDRKLRELADRLALSLDQRDLLLGEVHHRVKNNLQQINALLQLEGSKVFDPVARDGLRATARRVAALGAVHRLLVSSEVPSRVSSPVLLNDVAQNAMSALPSEHRNLSVEVDADDFLIHIDLAATLSLLITEFITTMLYRPPPAGWFGALRLKLLRHDGGAVLTIVHAGGAALPRQRAGESTTSDRIIHGLIGQLNARLTTVNDNGLSGVEVRIPPEAFIQSVAA